MVNMKRRNEIYKGLVIIIILSLTISIPVVLADWYLDAQYTSDMVTFELECEAIYDWMDGEEYDEEEWLVWLCEDWPKEDIIDTSMGWAKVWHFAGHGNYISGSNNWIIADDGNIRAWEIPDLDDVEEGGGNCLLMFFNACHSGRINWLLPNRWLTFESISEGAKASIGHEDTVTVGEGFDFADKFYELTSEGENVGDAFDDAKDYSDAEDAVIRGNQNTVLFN